MSRILLFIIYGALFTLSAPLHAEKIASIIIDDIGNNLQHGQDIINLPAALTIAILPDTRYAKGLAKLARENRKEVMLHLPMQSVEHHDRSPGTLHLHMTQSEFARQLIENLDAIPHISGVNNHMGSLLTRHPGHMTWLMEELSRRSDLYFIDSRTTTRSIASQIASEFNIPNMQRDFFLDPDNNENTLRQQFNRFINAINQRSYALAIAHPYPETIKFLQNNLSELQQQGITLVPVSQLIKKASQLDLQGDNHVACTSPSCTGL